MTKMNIIRALIFTISILVTVKTTSSVECYECDTTQNISCETPTTRDCSEDRSNLKQYTKSNLATILLGK